MIVDPWYFSFCRLIHDRSHCLRQTISAVYDQVGSRGELGLLDGTQYHIKRSRLTEDASEQRYR